MRRRRPKSEIAFGFDSFLDLVANVVGIILKLILVAFVGARTYKAFVPVAPSPPLPVFAALEPLPEPTDARSATLPARENEIELENLKLSKTQREKLALILQSEQLQRDLEALLASEKQLSSEVEDVNAKKLVALQRSQLAAASVEELQARSKALLAELQRVQKQKIKSKEFRYRTPILMTIQDNELAFECRRGRLTLINFAALRTALERDVRRRREELHRNKQLTASTSPIGAFRFRYTIEPELNSPWGGYTLAQAELIPVVEERGETTSVALSEGSAFRKLLDRLDAKETAVTMWVYPDSFEVYRSVRDWLHERKFVVAGRPLPEGQLITASPKGTRSRGQ
jgi:hypothetical protein